jgi:hypothetical protein
MKLDESSAHAVSRLLLSSDSWPSPILDSVVDEVPYSSGIWLFPLLI